MNAGRLTIKASSVLLFRLAITLLFLAGLAWPLPAQAGPPPARAMRTAEPLPVTSGGPTVEAASAPGVVPATLSPGDWRTIQDLIRQAEYDYTWHQARAAHVAPNRAQGWHTALGHGRATVAQASGGSDGAWQWSLSLQAFGYAGALQTVAAPPAVTVAHNRVTYHWDSNLTEWYVNDERGLEQGFTINRRPATDARQPGLLMLQLALDTDLRPRLVEGGQAIAFDDASGRTVLRYAGLRVSDAGGRSLPASLSLSRHSLSIGIDDARAVYPLIVDPLVSSQMAVLTADDGTAEDFFGWSVAVWGTTVVVGAAGAQIDGRDQQGAVYIFERNYVGVNTWGQMKKLTAGDGAAGDWFGSSVALSGDTLVVGALGDEAKRGAAYIFSRDQGGVDHWGQVKKLAAPDGAAGDRFGVSTAISGDTAIVGARSAKVGSNDEQGAAYVFARNHSGAEHWGQVSKLTAGDGAAGDLFGSSVAISGDTAIVGAQHAKVGSNDYQGAAYVFGRNESGADQWGQVTKLTAGDGAAEDSFGFSVGISGDTAIVGAHDAQVGAHLHQGAAYVFYRNRGGADHWGQAKKLISADGAAGDEFGYSVAIDGDTVVVTAGLAAVGHYAHQGAAYAFDRDEGGTGQWGQVAKLTAGDSTADDLFGLAVAIQGNTLVVGACFARVGGNDYQGKAYTFVRSANTWLQQAKVSAADGAAGDSFGRSVAISGDTAVVGAWSADISGEQGQGAAYVLSRNQGGSGAWGPVSKLTAADGAAGDWFGNSVAISGDTVIVGAPDADSVGDDNQGAAYVFYRNRGGADKWGQVKKLTAADGAAQDEFGHTVAISGGTAVVGTAYHDSSQGAAYVYARNSDGMGGSDADNWGQVQKLVASDGQPGDLFGLGVAISGDTVVASAPFADVGANRDQGAAYVFYRNRDGADNWGQVRKLIAADGAPSEYFGFSVGIGGDTVVAGAPDANIGGHEHQGAAYVFYRNRNGADNWGQVRKLADTDGAGGDMFGASVGISLDTVVVGAYGADIDSHEDQGSAYVFDRNEGGADQWGRLTRLTADDGTGGDEFGYSVAISGDTVVVGAHLANVGGNPWQGAAYVYERPGNAWLQQVKSIAADGAANDWFGYSLAMSGDTAVIGSPYATVSGDASRGAAYVHARNADGLGGTSDGVWGQVQTLIADDGDVGDNFGMAVAISGDTAVVGAYNAEVDGKDGQGAAYVFVRNSNGAGGTAADQWGQVQKLVAGDGAAWDGFGRSLAISGDTVIAGAPYANGGQGAAYVFARNQGGADQWGQVQKLTVAAGTSGDWFGWAVDIHHDLAIVGAPFEAEGINDEQGVAYIFARNSDGAGGTAVDNWGQVKRLTGPGGKAEDWFGYAVAISDDTAVVGAPYENVGGNADQGSVRVFGRNRDGVDAWGLVAWRADTDGVSGDRLGSSLDLDGNAFIAGAPGTSGRAQVFSRNFLGGDAWLALDTLTASDGVADDAFGTWVAISGDTALAGAPYAHVDDFADQGAAYAFRLFFLPPSIAVAKKADVGQAMPGQKITYTYYVTNTGQVELATIFGFDDRLGQVPPDVPILTLAPLESATTTLAYTVAATDLPGPLTNRVTLSGTSPTGIEMGAAASETVSLVRREADLSMTKSVVRQGLAITYTVVARNLGPAPAPGATVSDTMPTSLSGVSWTCSASGGATCAASGTGDIRDTLATFPAGGAATYTIRGSLKPGELTVNTAQVMPPADPPDPELDNNRASVSIKYSYGVYLPLVFKNR